MAKKAKKAAKTAAKKAKRSSQKRDLVKGRSASSYAKRRDDGTFKEMDDTGRSQRGDRRRRAKKKVKSGYGDRGER